MTPVIGVTCGHQWDGTKRHYVNEAYITSVLAAGGLPILIPHMNPNLLLEVIKQVDAVLIPGGIDIDANLFNQEIHPRCGKIDPLWDELDLTVIRAALERDLPLLAICRGCQILNVACGGDLVQDIPSQVKDAINHNPDAPKWHATHDIAVTDDSKLAKLLGTTSIRVNSFHHQAVARIAPGLQVSAVASDGVIEGIESKEHGYVIGVQWHPELMIKHHPVFKSLFTELIKMARLSKNSG